MARFHTSICALLALFVVASASLAQGSGRLEGRVARADGSSVGGVAVTISELGRVEITGSNGTYAFGNVPEGSYTVSFSLGDDSVSASDVEINAGATTTLDETVEWDTSFIETITVYSASKRTERLVEAPAAVTSISPEAIEEEASHGQLPALLASSPGAEPTQSGVYDFNFNTRGFNSSLNRRVLVLVDGRDPSAPFLGSQEWASLPFSLDELASLELVRGPGSALYGADAFNGVINMVTKSPRYAPGGQFKLTGGDLDTLRGDLRVGGALGNDWYGRLSVGYLEGEDFTRSRNVTQEYAGLNPEPVPLFRDDIEVSYASARLDKYFGASKVLTLDVGQSQAEGITAVTGIGRVQINESTRPYARVNFNTPHWNVLGYYNDRDANNQLSLSSGVPLYLDTQKYNIEVQGNTGFAEGKGQLIGGVNYGEEEIDSINPQGVQTLMFQPVDADFTGVFGQLEYAFNDKVKVLVAGRWDDSSLVDSQFSPRAALVYSINPTNTLRFNYGEAFQTPNYSELFLSVPVAPPLTAAAALEGLFCAPFGVSCGLTAVPVLALGNPNVEVEEIRSFEVGYSGIFNNKTFVTIDYYNTQIENFITDLITAFNPALGGRINPAFGPYQAPAGIPEPFASLLEGTLAGIAPLFSNNPLNGNAILGAVSYTNFGEVDTQGLEIGINHYINNQWSIDASYTWFDFDVGNQLAGDPLLPNTAENRFGLGVTYRGEKLGGSLKYRHSESFPWNAGVFSGEVPAFDVVDLVASYQVTDAIELGVNVTNLFDDKHFEIFGGDILERRALGHIAYRW